MPQKARRTCLTCGGHVDDVGPISWGGNCAPCGQANMVENIYGIATKSGYAYRRMIRGVERFVQRARLDIAEPNP